MDILPTNNNIYFSKGTWKINGDTATCYNGGANFNFTTDAFTKGNKNIVLTFEMPNVADGYSPILAWRVNGLIWQYAHMTEQMTITLPEGINDATESPVMNGIANHYVEVWIRTVSLLKPRWSWNGNFNNNVVILKSITIDDGASILETVQSDMTMLSIGASFTEGYGTVGKENDDFKSNDTTCSWGVLLGKSLGFNVATSGYAGSGFSKGGNGNSPSASIAYKYMDDSIERDYTGVDIASFNIGSNDGGMPSTDFIVAASNMINDLRKRYPQMILLFTSPFWGGHQSDWEQIGKLYANDPKIISLWDTVYPQLKSHPTITNYFQYILPDLVNKTRRALFQSNSNDNSKSVVDINQPSVKKIWVKPANNFEQLRIRKF